MKQILCISLLLGWLASPVHAEATKSVRLVLPPQPSPLVENIGRVLSRQIQQRCDAKVITAGDAPLVVELAVRPGIGTEGFQIEDRPGRVYTRLVAREVGAPEEGARHVPRHPFSQLLSRRADTGP